MTSMGYLDSVEAHFYTRANLRNPERTLDLIRFVLAQGTSYQPKEWYAARATHHRDERFSLSDLERLVADLTDPDSDSVTFQQEPLGPYHFLLNWGFQLPGSPQFLSEARTLLKLPQQYFVGEGADRHVEAWLLVLRGLYKRMGAHYGYSHETHDHNALTTVTTSIGRLRQSGPRTDAYVPALFWSNFLGPDLVKAIHRGRIKHAPCWKCEPLYDGGILLVFSPNPLDIATTRELRQRLYLEWDLERLTKPVYRPAPDAPVPIPPTDAVVESSERCRELAEVCVQTAQRVSGVQLDYSPASLQLLDTVIEQGWSIGAQPHEVIAVMGCYLGETIIRQLGGEWSWEEVTSGISQPHVQIGRQHLNVIGKVRKRFQLGQVESLAVFFTMAQSLAAPS